MDPRDSLVTRLGGVRCTACDSILPADGIRSLARRDDLAFVELRCSACNTRTIGVLTVSGEAAPVELDLSRYGEFDATDEARLGAGRALGGEDVLAMRAFLSAWTGDFRSLLGSGGSPDGTGPRR
jgi:hypothetical protein